MRRRRITLRYGVSLRPCAMNFLERIVRHLAFVLLTRRGCVLFRHVARAAGRGRTGSGKRISFTMTLSDSAEIHRATDSHSARMIVIAVVIMMLASFASTATPTSAAMACSAGARTTWAASRFGWQLPGQAEHE